MEEKEIDSQSVKSENNENKEEHKSEDKNSDNKEADPDLEAESNLGSDVLSDDVYSDYYSSDYGSVDNEQISDKDDKDKTSDIEDKPAENPVEERKKSKIDPRPSKQITEENSLLKQSLLLDKNSETEGNPKRKKTVRASGIDKSGRHHSSRASGLANPQVSKGPRKSQNLELKSSAHKRGSKMVPEIKKPDEKKSGAEFIKKMDEKRKELQNVNTEELLRKLLSKELKIVEERRNFPPEPVNRPETLTRSEQHQQKSNALPPKAGQKKYDDDLELLKIPKEPALLKKELEVLNSKMNELNDLIYMKELELESAHVELFETHGESNIESTVEEDAIKKQLEELRDLLKEFEKRENEQNHINNQLNAKRDELNKNHEEIRRLDEANKFFAEEQRKLENSSDYSTNIKILSEYRELKLQREFIQNNHDKILENLNQRLEEKALLKEDLNGKLLQRAELVAQREDLEEIYNEFQMKYKEDLKFNLESNKLELNIKSLEFQIAEASTHRRELISKQESLMEEIERLGEEIPKVKEAFQNSLKEKNELILTHNTEFQNFEVFINSKTKELGLPEIQDLFIRIGKAYGETLEREVLIKQLNFIEEEEHKMIERFDKKFETLQSKLAEAFSQQNEEMVADVKEQMELLHGRTALRKDAISKWKSEVGLILNGNESHPGLSETFNKDKFLEYFALIGREKNITPEQEKLFQNALSLYIQTLEQHDSMIKEKDIELRELDNLYRNLEEKQSRVTSEISKIDSEIKRLEANRTRESRSMQELQSEINQRESLLEIQIAKDADQAFREYLMQQQAHFENISRTYGSKAANKLKQDNYKQFLDIMRKNHKSKWEKFKKVEADGAYYDKTISYNIKFVDDIVVPNLKKTMGLISELKEQVKKAKKEDDSLEDKERALEIQAKNLEMQIKLRAIANLQIRYQQVDFLRIEDSFIRRQNIMVALADEIDELEHQLHEAQISYNKDEIVSNIERLNVRLAEIDELKLHLGELRDTWDKKEEEIELLRQELNQLNNRKNYFAKNLLAPQSASKQKNNVFQTTLDSENHPNRSTAFFGSSGKKSEREEQSKNSYSNNKEDSKRKYIQQQHIPSYVPNNHQIKQNYINQSSLGYHISSANDRPRSAPRSVYTSVLHQSYNAPGNYGIKENNTSLIKMGRRAEEAEDEGSFEKTIRFRPPDGHISFRNDEPQFNENMIRNKPIQDVLKMVEIGPPNPTMRVGQRTDSNPKHRGQGYQNNSLNGTTNQVYSANPYQNNDSNYDDFMGTKGPLTQQLQSIFPNMKEKQAQNYLNISEKKKQYIATRSTSMDQQNYLRTSQDQRTVQKQQVIDDGREANPSNRAIFNVKINFDKCTEKEYGFLESIRPLLEGAMLYKKFSTNPNSKQQGFNPLRSGEFPPEYCGFSQRIAGLHRNLNRFEFRSTMKPGVDLAINIEEIMRAIVPQLTTDIVKLQKKLASGALLNENEIMDELRAVVDSNIVLQSHINLLPKLTLQDLKNVSFYPFYLILERGGRVELIAQDYQTLRDWVNGINLLIKNRKILPKMKGRLEINGLN